MTGRAGRVLVALVGLLFGAAEGAVVAEPIPLPVQWTWYFGSSSFRTDITGLAGLGVASNGTDFLVVWSEVEQPAGPAASQFPDDQPVPIVPGVRAIRISASGAVLDEVPIEICDHADARLAVAGSSSGTYLVVSACGAVRVSAEGVVMGPPVPLGEGGIPDGSLSPFFKRWAVAVAVGSSFYVFSGGEVARLDAWGQIVSRTPVGFTPSAVASDGVGMLAVWDGGSALVDASGATTPVATPVTGLPAVAFDGSDYVVLGFSASPAPSGLRAYKVIPDGGSTTEPAMVRPVHWVDGTPPLGLSFDGTGLLGVRMNNPMAEWGGAEVTPFRFLDGAVSVAASVWLGSKHRMLFTAANALGTHAVVIDGASWYPYVPNAALYRPTVRLITTWAPLGVTRTGSGRGEVSSAPAGIDCGPSCLAAFDAPTVVTLTATPAPGSSFVGWAGACSGLEPVCSVTLDAARDVEARFADVTPPQVNVPERVEVVATSTAGQPVSFVATAWDELSGQVETTCSRPSGALFAPGVTPVTCTASDAAGNVGSASFTVAVRYSWSGVLFPIRADGHSVFKRGRVVPVRFALTGASARIRDLQASLVLTKVSDRVEDGREESFPVETADPGADFRFNRLLGFYVHRLATRGLAPGTWQADIVMSDGVERRVTFTIRP